MGLLDKIRDFINPKERDATLTASAKENFARQMHASFHGDDSSPWKQAEEWRNGPRTAKGIIENAIVTGYAPEGRRVLKMEPNDRQEYYQEFLGKFGQKELDRLLLAVERQREFQQTNKTGEREQPEKQRTKEVMANVTPEQAKTLLQSDAHHALSLNPKERKDHYKNVRAKQGEKALEKLLREVRKQRSKSNELGMG